MNYPAAGQGVSKERQKHENHLEASFGVYACGEINSVDTELNGEIEKN
jgi:hypothetical protein